MDKRLKRTFLKPSVPASPVTPGVIELLSGMATGRQPNETSEAFFDALNGDLIEKHFKAVDRPLPNYRVSRKGRSVLAANR